MEVKTCAFFVILLILILLLMYSHLEMFRNNFMSFTEETEKELVIADDTSHETYVSHIDMLFDRASFERDSVNCSVKVFTMSDKEKFDTHMKRTGGWKRKCSVDVFREYFKKKDEFFGDGVWYVIDKVLPETSVGDFYPEGCIFDKSITENITKFSICLNRRNIRKILITGDSNGNRYSYALEYFLCNQSKSCQLDSRGIQTFKSCEYWDDWSEYFRVPNKTLFCVRPGCPHCLARTVLVEGFGPNNLNLKLEFIGTVSFINNNIRFRDQPDMSDFILDKPNHPEVLLRDYLPYYGFPDIWFISPPTHHESWAMNLEGFETIMNSFRRLMDHYLPTSTKVMLFADIRECAAFAITFAQKFYEQMNTTRERNEVFHAMNQVIFDAFRDRLLEEDGQYIGFLDAGKILCPFTCNWHEDDSHMRPFVYDLFWKYIFQYLCTP